MTKEQLTDVLAWMQNLQAKSLHDLRYDVDIQVNATKSFYSELVLKIWVEKPQDWCYFTIEDDYTEDKAAKVKDEALAYLEQFGIKPYAA